MEYPAVVWLHTLIMQEAEVEQTKVQEIILKKAVDELATNTTEADNQKGRALIKAGEILAPPQLPIPVSCQSQSQSTTKAIKAPILL